MAAPALSPQQATAKLLQDIQAIYPNLQEPHKGATDYAIMVLNNPEVDENVCQQVGKVVIIVAKLAEKAEHSVTIRGNLSPLDWDNGRLADPQKTNIDFFSRKFTIHLKQDQMDKELEFKLLSEVPGSSIPRWAKGNNVKVDMKQHGHITKIELSGVSFN